MIPQEEPKQEEKPENPVPPESTSVGKPWENWGKTQRWGYGQPQPSPEAKKAGWAKKKRNRELAQLVLGMKFVGSVHLLDPKTGEPIKDDNGNYILVPSEFKEKLGRYHGLSAEQIENLDIETAMMLRMVGQAIEKGDNAAAQIVLERAYGKPKEFIELSKDNDDRPVINITVMQGNPDTTPDIKESENEIE
jgi:hypothetical protein